MRIWVYPGSFDPITVGHINIIERASRLCDSLIVAVLRNTSRVPIFSMEERLDLLRLAAQDIPGVQVDSFGGLLADYMRMKGAQAVVRGVRRASDYEYETQMALMNRRLYPGMDTIFLPAEPAFAPLSSTVVRDIGMLGGNVSGLVPEVIREQVEKRFQKMNKG